MDQQPQSYDMTPARHELPPEPLRDEDNYGQGFLKVQKLSLTQISQKWPKIAFWRNFASHVHDEKDKMTLGIFYEQSFKLQIASQAQKTSTLTLAQTMKTALGSRWSDKDFAFDLESIRK